MANTRTVFWEEAQALLQQTPPDFAAVDALVQNNDGGWALITAPNPAGVLRGVQHPIGGPRQDCDRGAQGFLLSWEPNSSTGIHGHPPLMYLAVIAGTLEVDTYDRTDPTGPVTHLRTQMVSAGQAIHAVAQNDRFDNFIHSIRSTHTTWSLHIYGDDPGLGARFDETGQPTQ